MVEYDPLKRDTIGSMRIITALTLLAFSLVAQTQQISTWPPLNNTPGPVYVSPNGPSAMVEPLILGPGVQKPVHFQFGWIVNALPAPVAVLPSQAGWIPLVPATVQPGDGTERWCYPNVPNLDMTIDNILITRAINPTAIKELYEATAGPPIATPGVFQYEAITVVAPGPILDGSLNTIRITPWWSRSDAACPGQNPGVILTAIPTTTPGVTTKRTSVLVLANW